MNVLTFLNVERLRSVRAIFPGTTRSRLKGRNNRIFRNAAVISLCSDVGHFFVLCLVDNIFLCVKAKRTLVGIQQYILRMCATLYFLPTRKYVVIPIRFVIFTRNLWNGNCVVSVVFLVRKILKFALIAIIRSTRHLTRSFLVSNRLVFFQRSILLLAYERNSCVLAYKCRITWSVFLFKYIA